MNYREMLITDYDQAIRLWKSCDGLNMRDADSREGIRKYLKRNPGFSFVAESEAGIIATLMAGHDGKRGYIQHLAVATSDRGNGIASKLVEYCLEALQHEGIAKSHVHVKADNAVGREFWSRHDWFQRDEIVMYSYINGSNDNA